MSEVKTEKMTTTMWNMNFKSAEDGVETILSIPQKDIHVLAQILKESLEAKGVEVHLEKKIPTPQDTKPETKTSNTEKNVN
jgi:hypothetical protein